MAATGKEPVSKKEIPILPTNDSATLNMEAMRGTSSRVNADLNSSGQSGQNEIVISGISCRLPESENMEEFEKNLFNGVDMITEDDRRYTPGLYGLPTRSGKLKFLDKFDAQYFGVHPKQANRMDPQLRMLLELSYEAIIDSGVNPTTIRGSNTGVFIGACESESKEVWSSDPEEINGYEMTGCSRSMFSNRISYTFDLKGPSLTLDTACSSGLMAVEQAVTAIRNGKCDAAIVGGVKLLLKPQHCLEVHKLNLLAMDGKCKAFDSSGDGYVQSEAAVVIYIQKAGIARRSYATILHAKTNTDGYKEQGVTFPSGDIQKQLLKEIYSEAGLDPNKVSYLEAHGTGTKAGDTQELNAIADILCKGRDSRTPLLIGSIKSNMGHSEHASGLCSIAKVILAMQNGLIPANLHFKEPNHDVPALHDGKLKVIKENEQWGGGIVGINSFGFGGANVHIILESPSKQKAQETVKTTSVDPLPILVPYSGRSEEFVEFAFKELQSKPKVKELFGLFHEIACNDIQGHNFRGYCVMTNEKAESDVHAFSSKEKLPVWFVFSGMGSQWSGMGKDLLKFEIFLTSIKKSAEVLRPYGIDLVDIITNGDEETLENILKSSVAIAAIQVALVDLLQSLEITPDGMIGHSAGELGCAYADGCFTAEQTVLVAYFRAKAVLELKGLPGAMAAVGLTWEESKIRCPPDIFLACHNAIDSVSISGPVDSIQNFVSQLKNENIFAKAIKSSGQAFHSKYISEAGPQLQEYLNELIRNPKRRSTKWISSSIPENDWDSPLAKTSSASYHINNMLSPVLFHEAVIHIPDGALVIEIAPHSLLQAILKRSLSSNTVIIGLMNRNSPDNAVHFLSSIGKTYLAGLNPRVSNLYRKVHFPVSLGTPMISPMIKWDHSISWDVAKFGLNISKSGENIVEVSLNNEKDAYLAGHCMDSRIIFPATGYMFLAWKTLAKLRGTMYDQLPVVFENIRFIRATILQKDIPTKFKINIFEETGLFEVREGGSVVMTGQVHAPENMESEILSLKPHDVKTNKHIPLNASDVYKELSLRGYNYQGIFKGIKLSDNQGNWAKLKWEENWVAFLDTLLHFSILSQPNRRLYLPTGLQRVAIDPQQFKASLSNNVHLLTEGIPVYKYKHLNVIKCNGIEIRGLKTSIAPRRHTNQSVVKQEHTFISYFDDKDLKFSMEKALRICTDIVVENTSTASIKVNEIVTGQASVSKEIHKILMDSSLYQVNMGLITLKGSYNFEEEEMIGIRIERTNSTEELLPEKNCHLIVIHEDKLINGLDDSLNERGFVLLSLPLEKNFVVSSYANFNVVARKHSEENQLFLFRKKDKCSDKMPLFINIDNFEFDWVEILKKAMKEASENLDEHSKIYLVSENQAENGILGLINCLKTEPYGDSIRGIFTKDKSSLIMDAKNPKGLLKIILQNDLVQNVISGEHFGSYRHLPLNDASDKLVDVENAFINTTVHGDLSSLCWIEGPLDYFENNQDIGDLCQVYYAPLNFRDVMLATGKLSLGNLGPQDCVLGMEFSGKNSQGKRVMGLVPSKCLATSVVADKTFIWEVPNNWTLEEAATVPLCYSTAYYALIIRGHMRPGESVLIHSGSAGMGQAAISIALSMNCEVFTTVGSAEKKEILKSRFPELKDKNFCNSWDASFEQHILKHTEGKGVNLVLNSLAEDKLQASIRCLAKHGRFLETGKFDLSNEQSLGVAVFLKNITFHGIPLDALFDEDFSEKLEVVALVEKGIKTGVVIPLPRTVFSDSQIEDAFRFMASGKHVGKVILKIREETAELARKTVKAFPKTYFDSKKSCIIVGGLGGFGLELAGWLIERGVRKMVLVSRSGVISGYQDYVVRRWREKGISVEIPKDDLPTLEGTRNLILRVNEQLGAVGAVFNLAMVLKDGFIENQTKTNFLEVSNPKIDVTLNLDKATRVLCPYLDHFVVFSSTASGRGNVGQSNYGFANSAMERICELRQKDGLPGLAIQWGAIGDVGVIQDHMGGNETIVGGTVPQGISSCLQTLEFFLQQNEPIVSSLVLPDRLTKNSKRESTSLVDYMVNVLGMKDFSNVNENASFAELGMDSLMGVEVKQTLEKSFDLVLSMKEIRTLTMKKLKQIDV